MEIEKESVTPISIFIWMLSQIMTEELPNPLLFGLTELLNQRKNLKNQWISYLRMQKPKINLFGSKEDLSIFGEALKKEPNQETLVNIYAKEKKMRH